MKPVLVALSLLLSILFNSTAFAQSGCCSSHNGVCGCSEGRSLCCDGTLSPSCLCQSPTYTVTLTQKGSGSGTMNGSGSYLAGNIVLLNASPATGSTFTGWTPLPCAANFIMPASALICTANFITALGGDNDIVLIQAASRAITGAGSGDDTYILTPYLLTGTENITISDTQGNNLLQLANGLMLTKSDVAATALQLTISNGAKITILGANAFRYDIGGNAAAGINNTPVNYAAFAQDVLGVAVPTDGVRTGGAVTITSP